MGTNVMMTYEGDTPEFFFRLRLWRWYYVRMRHALRGGVWIIRGFNFRATDSVAKNEPFGNGKG